MPIKGHFILHYILLLFCLSYKSKPLILEQKTLEKGKNTQILHEKTGVQHLLHLKSKSKILRPIEIMGFFYEFICQIQGNILL